VVRLCCLQVGKNATAQIQELTAGDVLDVYITPRDDIGSLIFWPVTTDFIVSGMRAGAQQAAFALMPEHTGNSIDAYSNPPRILVLRHALQVRSMDD
jgi:hypothetical protein